jgi:hypothetical protein
MQTLLIKLKGTSNMMNKKMQVEGKKSGGAESSLKPVDVRKAASLGNAAKTPKKSGQLGD